MPWQEGHFRRRYHEDKKVSSEAASALVRLNSATKDQSIRGGRTRPVCVRGRHYVANRLLAIGKMTLEQKARFLKSCPYLSLSVDESDTYALFLRAFGIVTARMWTRFSLGQLVYGSGGCS